jgi:hypothetical protein
MENDHDDKLTHKYLTLLEFISNCDQNFCFLHTTNSLEKAESICHNGFVYSQFDKTTDYVCDIITLAYMLNIRKHYGDFTIVIQIDHSITNYAEISIKEYDVEGEEIFILPPQYIKGYYNRTNHEIIPNPLFKYI